LVLTLPLDPRDFLVSKFYVFTCNLCRYDEAAINGEPIPRTKKAGDSVSAGTVNCDGAITVQVVSSGEETQVAGIVRMVEAGAYNRPQPSTQLFSSLTNTQSTTLNPKP
jgi:high-affinity K+ transport system ATPase subunit B